MTPVIDSVLLQQIAQAWERTARGLAQDVTTMRAEVEVTRIQLEAERARAATLALDKSLLEVKLAELQP